MNIPFFLQIFTLIFLYMSFVFVAALYKKNNSIVDIAWGIGFVLIALYSFLSNRIFYSRQVLVTILTLLWGLRLSCHIFLRSRNKAEDPRYAQWRKEWGNFFIIRSYLQIFMLQGVVMFIIALPIMVINLYSGPGLNLIDFLGMSLWMVGFFFEAIGDFQLQRFLKKASSKGKIMKYGLWAYTRHPNYFGEVTLWWGMYLLALSVPYGWLTFVSPLTISYLLLYVSGIPMLERQFANNEEFQQYKKETSPFFPWFKKNH